MADIKLDVLAIAAHPDDIEITCGGLMIKFAKMGRKTGALDLTRGEMGTFGTQADRDAEAIAAGEIMGLSYRNNLSIPDSSYQNLAFGGAESNEMLDSINNFIASLSIVIS